MKTIMKCFARLSMSIVVGMLLLIGVYALPVENMKANVARSSEVFNYEGVYPQLSFGYKYTQLDGYTDSIMLGAAIFEGGGTIKEIVDRAVNNYHYDCYELSPVLALTNYANHVDYEYVEIPYGRYWHGYLVPLKSLLIFFDYSDIRILNFFFQNFLLFIVLREFCKSHLEQYTSAFLTAVFVLNPLTAALSLQFSTVYYIVLLSAIYVLRLSDQRVFTEEKANKLFSWIGILIAYFDFLTYPIASFGIVYTLYFLIRKEERNIVGVRALLQKGMFWMFGYCGMWCGKWLVGSILLRRNMFTDAWAQVMVRTSMQNFSIGAIERLQAIYNNISVFLKWPFSIVFLLTMGYYIFQFRKLTFERLQHQSTVIIVLLITAFLPFGWIFVVANHSAEHYWFTYKVFSVSVFALLSLASCLVSDSKADIQTDFSD